MSLAKRVLVATTYTLRCSYCGTERTCDQCNTLSEAGRFFESLGWMPHPRSILAVLCQRCGTLYPDFAAIDGIIEDETPF